MPKTIVQEIREISPPKDVSQMRHPKCAAEKLLAIMFWSILGHRNLDLLASCFLHQKPIILESHQRIICFRKLNFPFLCFINLKKK